MRKFRNYFASLMMCLAVGACGDDGTAPPEEELPQEEDTTAPTVVAVSPTDGSSGQRDDTQVSIQFSEPMDQASVEGTLDASDLGEVVLSWNAAGDTIYITPKNLLAYAEGNGTDPSTVAALSFTVTLGNAAKDKAGNAFGAGVQSTFTTLKSMAATFELDDEMTRSLTAEGDLIYDAGDPLGVGDLDNDEGMRAVFTFDLADLPAEAIEIAAATFATRQQLGDKSGLPYGNGNDDDGLGSAVLIDHVSYAALDNAAYNSSEAAHAQLGVFCVDEQVVIEADVTTAVESDRANRATRGDVSQYLLRFALHNDEDGDQDRVVISRDLSELQVEYLVP